MKVVGLCCCCFSPSCLFAVKIQWIVLLDTTRGSPILFVAMFKKVLSGQIRTRWIRYGVILLPHFFPSFFRFLLLSFFLFFKIFLTILSFLVCLSAHQHDNWLLILVISRVRLTPIVSIRLPWAINVTSDLSKGAQSPLSPVTAHQNGVKPSTAEPPLHIHTHTPTPLSPPPSVKSHTGYGVLLEIGRLYRISRLVWLLCAEMLCRAHTSFYFSLSAA